MLVIPVMLVVEIFSSKQGEGLWTGVQSTFVRVGGCNLCCRFCDTPYAFRNSGEGVDLCVEEIVERVTQYGRRHVVLTGGEPMIYTEMVPLTRMLKAAKMTITIETNGTLDLPVECDLMSISPKLGNSSPKRSDARPNPETRTEHESGHDVDRNRPEIVRALIGRYDYQLKFVIDTPEDLGEMESYLANLECVTKSRVLLMPLGTDADQLARRAEWIVPYCRTRGYRFSQRMHVIWYGNRRGT